jgi:hypothetical protein
VFESFPYCYLPSATGAKRACPKFITRSRVRRKAPLRLRRRALAGNRQAEVGRGREALRERAPEKLAATPALRARRGRVAQGHEARTVRDKAFAGTDGFAGGALPLPGRALKVGPRTTTPGRKPAPPVYRAGRRHSAWPASSRRSCSAGRTARFGRIRDAAPKKATPARTGRPKPIRVAIRPTPSDGLGIRDSDRPSTPRAAP